MDALTGRRVLILEEQSRIALLLAKMVEALGCEVVGPAMDVCQALDLIAENRVDVAILDVTIAGETTQSVADMLAGKGTPLVFVSGNKTAASIERYAPAKVITKPYSAENIRRVLTELLAPPGTSEAVDGQAAVKS